MSKIKLNYFVILIRYESKLIVAKSEVFYKKEDAEHYAMTINKNLSPVIGEITL